MQFNAERGARAIFLSNRSITQRLSHLHGGGGPAVMIPYHYHCPLYRLCVRLLVSSLLLSLLATRGGDHLSCFAAVADAEQEGEGDGAKLKGNNKKRLCLLPASFPWTFGPYQAQMYKLSLILAGMGHETLWMTRSEQSQLPEGVYRSWEEIRPLRPTIVPPPKDFDMSHLTFLGRGMPADDDRGIYGKNALFASTLNRLAQTYSIDAYITLLDLGQLVPDVEFAVPTIGWVPLHSGGALVSAASPDIWILRNYHAVAPLSPSSADAIAGALRRTHPDVAVEFVPHIIERQVLEERAAAGLERLRRMTPSAADRAIERERVQRDAAGGNADGHRGVENVKRGGKTHRLLSGTDDDTFMVLLQGGNYDPQDRKGWDTSLQAYAKFYHKYFPAGKRKDKKEESGTPSDGGDRKRPVGAHLYIHSIESYLAEADMNRGIVAPPPVLPQGILIPKRIYETGIPRSAYTLDIRQHEPEIVAALKLRADVCLHPSKVEGFGMNVVECQALGTPVITTNHTAMGDFTKLGSSVPHRQMLYLPGGIGYEFAMPDVDGIADALGTLYEEHLLLRSNSNDKPNSDEASSDTAAAVVLKAAATRSADVDRTKSWIDAEFSSERVGAAFARLIAAADEEFARREQERRIDLTKDPVQIMDQMSFRLARGGEHPEIVDWDVPWTLLAPDGLQILKEESIQYFCWALLYQEKSAAAVMVLPAKYEDTGEDVPILDDNGMPHPHLPILVRTYILTALQNQTPRRISQVYFAIQHAQKTGEIKRLPDGIAIMRRKKTSEGVTDSNFIGGDEL